MTFNKCSIKGKVYGNVPESQQGGAGSETDEVNLLFSYYVLILLKEYLLEDQYN